MKNSHVSTAACAILAVAFLSACPGLPRDGALLFIHNDSDESQPRSIMAIEFRGPGDSEFGPNVLEASLPAGESIDFLVDAPFRFQDEDGVRWSVRVTYEGFLGFDGIDVATFSCLHKGERTDWNWTPGDDIENRCVD